MRVLLCDHHAMFLDALAAALSFRGHEIVARTGSPRAAMSILADHRADAILMDVRFADDSGLDAAARISGWSDRPKVLLFTGEVDDHVWAAFDAGWADAVLRKSCDIDVVDRAIRRTVEGERVVEGFERHRRVRCRATRLMGELTQRERAVLALIAAGASTGQVAADLGVAETTVRTHLRSIFRKFGVNGRLKAVQVYFTAVEAERRAAHAYEPLAPAAAGRRSR